MTRLASDSADFLRSALYAVLGSGLPLACVSGFWLGARGLVSALLAAALAAVNLWLTARAVQPLLGAGLGGSASAFAFAACAKLLVESIALFALLQSGVIDGVGFAIGYAALPLGLVLNQFRALPSRPEES
jgi:hypothetical protein